MVYEANNNKVIKQAKCLNTLGYSFSSKRGLGKFVTISFTSQSCNPCFTYLYERALLLLLKFDSLRPFKVTLLIKI